MIQQPKSFVASIKSYFGLLPNQTLTDFKDELKALSYDHRRDFAEMLNAAGHPTEFPVANDERVVHK